MTFHPSVFADPRASRANPCRGKTAVALKLEYALRTSPCAPPTTTTTTASTSVERRHSHEETLRSCHRAIIRVEAPRSRTMCHPVAQDARVSELNIRSGTARGNRADCFARANGDDEPGAGAASPGSLAEAGEEQNEFEIPPGTTYAVPVAPSSQVRERSTSEDGWCHAAETGASPDEASKRSVPSRHRCFERAPFDGGSVSRSKRIGSGLARAGS
jgi:hypothetical protein